MKHLTLSCFLFIGCLYMPHAMALTLSSPDFVNNGPIPAELKCMEEGRQSGASPALVWGQAPNNTQSFVLTMEDPDAPSGTWVHWVVYNIPSDATGFSRGSFQGIAGNNSWNNSVYGGPCPPAGTGLHHYHFMLYALDIMLPMSNVAALPDILQAMEGHVLEKAELVGLANAL